MVDIVQLMTADDPVTLRCTDVAIGLHKNDAFCHSLSLLEIHSLTFRKGQIQQRLGGPQSLSGMEPFNSMLGSHFWGSTLGKTWPVLKLLTWGRELACV